MRNGGKIRMSAAGIVAGLALVIGGCGGDTDKAGGTGASEPAVLRFANNSDSVPPQIDSFGREVARLSEGTLRIEFVESWREGEPAQEAGTIEDVQAGDVDMAWVGARAFESVGVTSFQALVAPFLIDSHDLQAEVFAEGVPERMLESVETIGLDGIGVLPGPMRKMMGMTHPFATPSDFEGEVVGTSGGLLAEKVFEAFGATPKLVPAETSLDGLDALDYQLGAIHGNGFYETASHVTANLNLWPRPLVIFMNADRYDTLAPEQRDILRTAAGAAVEPALDAARAEDDEAGPNLCLTGMRVVESSAADIAAFEDAVGSVYADLDRNAETSGFLDSIRALKDEIGAPPDSFACSTEQAQPAAQAQTPIDGVYEVTTTVDDLVAAGVPRGDLLDENYGAWTYVFDRGRLAFTQENGQACTWAYGTYTVDGDQVAWSIVDGGGMAPNDASNKPGESFVFGWSLFRDALTLTSVPGEESPEIYLAKPLQLTGFGPSADVLSTRCPPPAEALSEGA
jgi:TRAP-type C4-dicarboxylate transport system substrate-binding protein